jgi:hypothetical protein
MRELPIIDRARRILNAAGMDDYGDGYVVMDICVGYAEPGYGSDDAVIAFGDWNPKRFPRDDDAPLTKAENLGPRLARALETAGCEIEWYDEWARCGDCQRAIRTSADSYSWTMYGAFVEDACEYICADCMAENIENYLPDYVNNAHRAVTFVGSAKLGELGFEHYKPDDPQTYEHGWHEGQDDNPETILVEILQSDENAEVVFLINSVGQFDMRFSAWVRHNDEEEGSR